MKTKINIIGDGRVGYAFKKVLNELGSYECNIFGKGEVLQQKAEIILIATPDNAINKVVSELRDRSELLKDTVVAHCSGVTASEVLKPLQTKGAHIACFHPIMAITGDTASFSGITFDIEGEEKALQVLEKLAEDLNADTLRVNAQQKVWLHIAAVFASNYLVTMAHIAETTAKQSGLDQGVLEALLPLMNSGLKNLEGKSPQQALTGPISRGDVETIKNHLSTLKSNSELNLLYSTLGKYTASYLTEDSLETEHILDLFDERD